MKQQPFSIYYEKFRLGLEEPTQRITISRRLDRRLSVGHNRRRLLVHEFSEHGDLRGRKI